MEKNLLITDVIVFLVHCSMLSLVMTSVTNISTDQQTLLSLKAHIINDPNNVLVQNWSRTTSVCTWIGITCDIHHNRVSVLNISYLDLTGTIPPQLGNLSFLTTLDIGNNRFYGSLPHELAQLRRLKHINFMYNNFNTEIPSWLGSLHKLHRLLLEGNKFIGAIPLSLANVSSLQKLNLCFNELSGSIPKEIGNLTNLKKMSICSNKLQGEIPWELGSLSQLESLELSDNSLTGPIPSLIFNLSSLIIMDLRNNSLMGSLPDNMCQHLPSLQALALSGNQLNGSIPYNLWQCRELLYVLLYKNRFEGRIPRDMGNLTFATHLLLGESNLIGEIPYEIGNLRNLERLAISMTNLTGHVPASIFNISALKSLGLSHNFLLGGTLPSSIGLGLPNLEILDLEECSFSGTIPYSITNATKLSILDLKSNLFSGFIPRTIGNLRSLEIFQVSMNLLTSTPDLSFLSSLTNCKNLHIIAISKNPLNGILPNSIGNLSISLESFLVEDCNISGNIPADIGNLNRLMALALGDNELSGSIPISLGKLQNLQGLYLASNKLKGFIPNDICHLERLDQLYLDTNMLSGQLPACLGNLTSIRILHLGSNKFTSLIPSTLWKLRDILYLNLSSNYLYGPLPQDIGNLKVVTELDLSWNHLSGDIPTTIGDLINLQLLNLSHNRFQGPIPKSVDELISVVFLDLSHTSLSGVIPKSFEALLYLKRLNLSYNQLEGNIPIGGPFANFSAESFTGNDGLCSSVLFHVPPCKISTHQKSSMSVRLLNIVFPSIALIVVVFVSIIVLKRCQKRSEGKTNVVDNSFPPTWRRVSYHELWQATDHFSEDNLLGTGSFGSVYKGRLVDGTEVAVKVFHPQLEGAFKSFEVECEVISSIRHRNLIKIINCCSSKDFKALILEYMPNGSLEQCLYSNNHFLDISQRLNIVIDVASALEYLHFGYSIPIVHCDVKPSNVMLDKSMVAHLSDFGITKILGEEESRTQTQTLATIGYMAPEYGRGGIVSRKGDVYSYGIMLMETFTRKKPTDEIFVGEMSLKHWVSDSLHDSVMEVVDINLLKREDQHFAAKEQCISSILSMAMECTRESPEMRVNIKEVLTELLKIRVAFLANIQITRRM